MESLKGQVVLVVGASSGIGRATAALFAKEGARVMAAARREDRLKGLRAEHPEIETAIADATDAANNALLLENIREHGDRTARFVCVIALVKDGRLVRTFRGAVEGRILDAPRGSGGFGYDPLFYYEPFGCTFGEAPIADKMRVSHRAQALEAMFTFLRGLLSSEIALPA